MSQQGALAASMATSASSPEKPASSTASARTPSTSASALHMKLRSCVTCRTRKVRCDKQSPCSNCRRANIACVFPSTDRPPRWARRLEHLNNASVSNDPTPSDANQAVDKVMDRLRTLENLVKELSGQLEQVHAATTSTGGGPSEVNSPENPTQDRDTEQQNTENGGMSKQFGRLVVQDANRSRYVSSGFWSRVNDEIEGLKIDTRGLTGEGSDKSDSSEDETEPQIPSSTREPDRHAFLFRNNLNLSTPELHELHPLPSQIPFLLDVFSENVNSFLRNIHMPTVTKMARTMRGSTMAQLTPSNEALMFSIYYAAITSMEEDEVITSFGSSKSDLRLKYRLGLQHALAKADFLNAPDTTLVQALAIFLCLARRHDSPRYVWMMTGLVIRMAQYLGLQRDGAHFQHLTPWEIESRRKIWWLVCHLDVRASEDQGTDLAITSGSFDTKYPSNFNDDDIDPQTTQMPPERHGLTDMSLPRVANALTDYTRRMMALDVRHGSASLEGQTRLMDEMNSIFDRDILQYSTELGEVTYWVANTVARLVMAKLSLLFFLPVLFSSPSEHMTTEIRTKLLISAIELAEYNHALNVDERYRHWRWIYQSHTHWYAAVYLLIEIPRRQWSPTVERAWVALHSSWLMPARSAMEQKRIWVPLRKMMAKGRQHRQAEVQRLQADPIAAARLEMDDQQIPIPSSSASSQPGSSVDFFRERWRQLVTAPEEFRNGTQTSRTSEVSMSNTLMETTDQSQPPDDVIPPHSTATSGSHIVFEPTSIQAHGQQTVRPVDSTYARNSDSTRPTNTLGEVEFGQKVGPADKASGMLPPDWADGGHMEPPSVPWLWADTNPSDDALPNLDIDPIDFDMEMDGEMNWYDWIRSANSMD